MNQPDQTRQPRSDVHGNRFSEDEEHALNIRRQPNHIQPAEPLTGLALSGGGVRSATFCFGLLRALAKNKVLLKFDYLSTVSGGGYTGAAFGRLFKEHVDARQVEEGVAYDGSELFWWLRRNGRYLLPAGMRDVMQTWAGQLRGFIATQFEVTMLFVLASCLIVGPHVVGYPWVSSSPSILTRSLWWLLMIIAVWIAIFMAFAYWWSRDRPLDQQKNGARNENAVDAKRPFAWIDFSISAAALLIAIGLIFLGYVNRAAHGNSSLTVIGVVMLAAPASGFWLVFKPPQPAQARVRFTIWLSTALKWMLGLAMLGTADLLTWFIADQVAMGSPHASVLTSAGLTAMLVAVARFTLPLLHARTGKNSKAQLPLTWVANFCGMVLILLLAVFWLSAVQYFIFFAELWPVTPWIRGITVAITCATYVVVTGGNLQLINLSSLHAFYRSRIARTYVSVGNSPDAPPSKRNLEESRTTAPTSTSGPDKGFRFPSSPLGDHGGNVRKLTEMLDGDDVALSRYTPHAFGGPIHLINCCINQTVDDRTDTYNADRKGVYLTVSSLGMETGTKIAQHADATPSLSQSTLAKWIAISGAAAGSGMGSMTRTGIAALFFLSGLRLGYWWNHDVEDNANILPAQQRSDFWWKRLGKSRAALQEMLAQFPGLQSPVWYLSDGGHFDNTGVYSLLKRRLKVIVLADCGADPHYAFADMENLVRKARVDMGTMIEFIDPASIWAEPGDLLGVRFGTPDTITPEPGEANLLLARITYPGGDSGCLLVVKPRLRDGLPLDVAGYADRSRDFPQQSTAEQFFDEAQWESYCQLGEVLGKTIDSSLLQRLPQLVAKGRPAQTSLLARHGKVDYDRAAGQASRRPATSGNRSSEQIAARQNRRQRIGATIGTSLSLGVLATVLVTAWQAWDSHVSGIQATAQVSDEQQRFVDTVQIDLESGAAYDPYMHARLYALLVQIDDAPASGDLPKAMHRLAMTLDRTCGQLGAAHALFDRCLEDEAALRDATARPSGWETSLHDYRDSPRSAASDPDMTTAMQDVCSDLGQRRHITVHEPTASASMKAPVGWSQPVFLYSADGVQSDECAQRLVAWLPTQAGFEQTAPRALAVPVPLYGDSGAIELWNPGVQLPPAHSR